jgi:AcrR family transcriptional regulator
MTGRPGEMAGRRRLSSEERRRQIINVTLDSVAEYGVRGTTLSRIAAGVGVTTPALYAHFSNRKEILLAALEVLFEHRTEFHRQPPRGTALERLNHIARAHTQLVESPDDRSMSALFEFIAAPQEEGLRETLGAKHLVLVEDIADIVRQGQQEGTIRNDADPEQIAWMIVSRAWAEDITQLMGIAEAWSEKRSNAMLDLILNSIAVVPPS